MKAKVLRVLAVAELGAFASIRRGLWADSIEVVGASAKSSLRLLHETQPDVVLLDLGLTQTDALQLLARLTAVSAAPVLALAWGPGAAKFARAAGASDVVECGSPDREKLHTLSSRIVALATAAHSQRESQRTSDPGSSLRSEQARPSDHSLRRSSGVRFNQPQSSEGNRPSARAEQRPATDRASLLRVSTAVPFKPSLPAALRRPMLIIGASTGGTLALPEVLRALPRNAPPVLVVQHMLPEFTGNFAERLNEVCALQVREALDGELLKPGHVLIAAGGRHLRIQRDGERFLRAVVSAEAPVGKHRPSIDVLFQACAEVLGSAAIGVLLTGMGDDGARGLLALRNAGARTIVQDQASSACFGMPSAAIACGAAQEVLSLSQIARTLAELYA